MSCLINSEQRQHENMNTTMNFPSFLRRGLRRSPAEYAGGGSLSLSWREEIPTSKTVKTVTMLWIPLFNPRLKSGAIEIDSTSQTILMVFFTAVNPNQHLARSGQREIVSVYETQDD